MKIFFPSFGIILGLLFPLFCHSQEVTNYATVTANGGVSVDDAGNLYVAHFGPLPPNPAIGKNIYKITPEGTVSLFVEDELNVGTGNDFDADGNLYQCNFTTGAIYQIGTDGAILDANYATVASPVGIAIAPDNSLYVCSCSENAIKKITPDGTISNLASGALFNCANGITLDNDGTIYTTNFSDGRVTKITPDGTAETLGSTPVGNGHIVYRPIENVLYVASYTGHQIFRMDLEGNIEPFAGTGNAETINAENPLQAAFNKPNGIDISKDNCQLYITQDDGVLRAITFDDAFCMTNVIERPHLAGITIYPNPVSNILTIENQNAIPFVKAQFLDQQGKVVLDASMNTDSLHQFNITAFPKGIYTIVLHSSSEQIVAYRFVKEE